MNDDDIYGPLIAADDLDNPLLRAGNLNFNFQTPALDLSFYKKFDASHEEFKNFLGYRGPTSTVKIRNDLPIFLSTVACDRAFKQPSVMCRDYECCAEFNNTLMTALENVKAEKPEFYKLEQALDISFKLLGFDLNAMQGPPCVHLVSFEMVMRGIGVDVSSDLVARSCEAIMACTDRRQGIYAYFLVRYVTGLREYWNALRNNMSFCQQQQAVFNFVLGSLSLMAGSTESVEMEDCDLAQCISVVQPFSLSEQGGFHLCESTGRVFKCTVMAAAFVGVYYRATRSDAVEDVPAPIKDLAADMLLNKARCAYELARQSNDLNTNISEALSTLGTALNKARYIMQSMLLQVDRSWATSSDACDAWDCCKLIVRMNMDFQEIPPSRTPDRDFDVQFWLPIVEQWAEPGRLREFFHFSSDTWVQRLMVEVSRRGVDAVDLSVEDESWWMPDTGGPADLAAGVTESVDPVETVVGKKSVDPAETAVATGSMDMESMEVMWTRPSGLASRLRQAREAHETMPRSPSDPPPLLPSMVAHSSVRVYKRQATPPGSPVHKRAKIVRPFGTMDIVDRP